ncbi:MAG: type II toxin-antitoxin system VapC family toxin [Fibrobacteres bacterium]|nr:type II toxin-antitoxin system VapC family toxin [Fibrobacterota bacterium]
MKFLLDTCVISELIRKKPNNQVLQWIENVDEEFLCISVLTIGEIQKGIDKLENGNLKKAELQHWLDSDLRERFKGRILSIDIDVAETWGRKQAEMEQRGLTLPSIDGLLAATALSHNMTLVTRNIQDIAHCGVSYLNPWEFLEQAFGVKKIKNDNKKNEFKKFCGIWSDAETKEFNQAVHDFDKVDMSDWK